MSDFHRMVLILSLFTLPGCASMGELAIQLSCPIGGDLSDCLVKETVEVKPQ